MTRMKDLITPEGRLTDSRINCHDVYAYLKDDWSHTEIGLALGIFPEQVLALIHYIVEHEEEVEENYQLFEEQAAKGNPPEIEAKLVETRARMQAWLQERHQQREKEQSRERSAG